MKEFTAKRWSILALVILIIVAFVLPAHAAEKKKFTINTTIKANRSNEIVYLEDKPRHELTQTVSERNMTSTNPDFNDMEVINYSQSDSIAGTGTHRGYSFYYHKKGDKAFTKWEGTHKTSIKEDKSWETIIEGKIEFIGGTGMFENIEGGGTYNCSATAKGGTCDAELEAEY